MIDDQLFQKQLNDLYKALEKDDIAGSARLIEQIGDAKNASAIEPLLILLGFHDERIRGCSATTLGKLGLGQAVEPLIEALKDPSVTVQEKAAIALGAIGDERATGPLENVPSDPARVKAAAEYSLRQIGSKNKNDPLFKRYNSGSRPVTSKPGRPVVADGGHAYPSGPAAPQVKTSVSAPQDVSAITSGKQAEVPEKISELQPKNPKLAALASFFIPGLGQLYNGEKITRALLYLVGFMIGTVLLVIPGILIWVYGIYKAYSTAVKINDGTLPNRKNNTTIMGIYAFCATWVLIVFLIAVFVLGAAVIAAFVFQTGSPAPGDHLHMRPNIETIRFDSNTIKITISGNIDASLTGIRVMVNGTEISPVSGQLTIKSGSSATYEVKENTVVKIVADFGEDTEVVWNYPV